MTTNNVANIMLAADDAEIALNKLMHEVWVDGYTAGVLSREQVYMRDRENIEFAE